MKELTYKQIELLRIIRAYVELNKKPPSFQEIGEKLNITKTAAASAIGFIKKKGYVKTTPGKNRSLEIIKDFE